MDTLLGWGTLKGATERSVVEQDYDHNHDHNHDHNFSTITAQYLLSAL